MVSQADQAVEVPHIDFSSLEKTDGLLKLAISWCNFSNGKIQWTDRVTKQNLANQWSAACNPPLVERKDHFRCPSYAKRLKNNQQLRSLCSWYLIQEDVSRTRGWVLPKTWRKMWCRDEWELNKGIRNLTKTNRGLQLTSRARMGLPLPNQVLRAITDHEKYQMNHQGVVCKGTKLKWAYEFVCTYKDNMT